MAKSHRKPASRGGVTPPVVDDATISQAITDLGITVPVYGARVVGDRLELTLYWGQVVYWPEEPERLAMAEEAS